MRGEGRRPSPFIFKNRGLRPQPFKRVTSQNLQNPSTNSQNTHEILVCDEMRKDQIAAIILIRPFAMFLISITEFSINPVNDYLVSINLSTHMRVLNTLNFFILFQHTFIGGNVKCP